MFLEIIYNNKGGGYGFGCRDGNGVWRSWKTCGDVRSGRKGKERKKEDRVLYFVFTICVYSFVYILVSSYFLCVEKYVCR